MTAIRKLANKIVLDTENIEFRKSGVNILTNVADDPSAVATAGTPGDLIITTSGGHFVKQDQGVTTNWISTTSGGGSGESLIKLKFTFNYTDFTSLPGTSAELLLFTLPTKAILTETVISETIQFNTGTGDTIGLFVGTEALAVPFVSQILGIGNEFSRNNEGPMQTDNSALLSVTSDTNIVINIQASGGTGGLADFTSGSFDVYLEYKLLAN